MESREKALKIAQILDDKKAKDIRILFLSGLTSIADYFVICSATSSTHVKALADEVEVKLKEIALEAPLHIEGYRAANWILEDYGDIIVHVFHEETREFYDLERLWTDAPEVEFIAKEN